MGEWKETTVIFFYFCCALLYFSVLCLLKILEDVVKKLGELCKIFYTQCRSVYTSMRGGATSDTSPTPQKPKERADRARKSIKVIVLSIIIVLVIVLFMKNYVLVSYQTKTTAAIQLDVLYAQLRQIALGPGATTSQTDNVKHRFVLQVHEYDS